ncbi:hypothetical protein Tco_1236355 [Tanacetum coccineum]
MSNLNLRSFTCSVTESEFVDFVDDFGIVMCYDPICPSDHQTALMLRSNFPGAYLVPRRSCCSWEGAPSNPLIFYGDEDVIQDFFELPELDVDSVNQNVEASVAHRLVQRRLIATALEESSSKRKQVVAVVRSSSRLEGKRRKQDAPKRGSFRGSVLPPVVSGPVSKGVGKQPRVLASHLCFDEQDVDPFVRDVQEAYSAHNLLSRLNCPSIQRRQDGLSFDELSNVYDDQALRLAMAGNMLTNESRIM